MTIAPVRPVQTVGRQDKGIQGYAANVPGSAETTILANYNQPFSGTNLIAAQMQRQQGIDAQNKVAAAAAEQQAQQFEKSLELERMKTLYGAFDTPFGGMAAEQAGYDPARTGAIEKQAADAAAAAIFQQKSAGLGVLGQAGAEMPSAAAAADVQGINWGERPDVSMNDADNRAQLEQAKIAANASIMGSQLGLQGAQARANADAMPRITTTVPGGATGISTQVQGTDAAAVQAEVDRQAGRTGRPTRAENVAPPEQQSAWGPALKNQAISKGYTVDEGAQVQFIDKGGQQVPAIVATRPDGSKTYVTGAPGG